MRILITAVLILYTQTTQATQENGITAPRPSPEAVIEQIQSEQDLAATVINSLLLRTTNIQAQEQLFNIFIQLIKETNSMIAMIQKT